MLETSVWLQMLSASMESFLGPVGLTDYPSSQRAAQFVILLPWTPPFNYLNDYQMSLSK